MTKKENKNNSQVYTYIHDGYEVEIDLTDPQLKTHCATCGDSLTPEWQRHIGRQYHIGDKAIFAICYYCATETGRIKSAQQIQEEVKEERRAARKGKMRVSKKKRKLINQRAEQMTKRPCGCARKGRHRRDCPTRKEG